VYTYSDNPIDAAPIVDCRTFPVDIVLFYGYPASSSTFYICAYVTSSVRTFYSYMFANSSVSTFRIDSSIFLNWTATVYTTVVTAIIMFSFLLYHRRRPYVIPLNSSHLN